jgi:hypothetical protein
LLLAEELERQSWTNDEIERARHLVCETHELSDIVGYTKSVTVAVFSAARKRVGGAKATRWCTGCHGTTFVNGHGLCQDCVQK